jgi:HAD superfamily hydrolase (TIGR01509 family)
MASGAASERAGVLFDVDGTLVDTTYVHTVTWVEALRQNGHAVNSSAVHHGIGMSGDVLLDHLLGADRDTEADDTIVTAQKALYKQTWGRLQTTSGAADLLRACAARGLDVVLASSAGSEELAMLRETIDADDAVTAATSSADAESGKPAPDILQVSLERAGLDAERALFIGDAVWDGASAGKAGVTFIGLTCGGTPESDLRDAGAVEVWRDPADLLEHLADSALGRLS